MFLLRNDAFLQYRIYRVHVRVVGKFRREVESLPAEVFTGQLQAARHHAPEQLAEHVNVEIGSYVFESLTEVSPVRHVVSGPHALVENSWALDLSWQEDDPEVSEDEIAVITDEYVRRLMSLWTVDR